MLDESQTKYKSILANLRSKNRKCFDCGGKNPAWGDIHFGLFVCFDCAGSHRSMGTHISFVRSTTFDQWSEHNLKKMIAGGNSRAFEYFSKYGLRVSKSKSHVDFYDSKVAKRYKEQLEKDAKALLLSPTPKTSPKRSNIDNLNMLMGNIKQQVKPSIVQTPPKPKIATITKPPKKVQKEVAELFNNMVVSTKKKVTPKSKKAKAAAKRKSRRGVRAIAVTQDNDESSDDDFEAEMAAAKTRKKAITPPPEDTKDEDSFVAGFGSSGFGTSKKKSQQQTTQNVSTQNVSLEVKTVFENKYGKNVRGGAKKMTSISSQDFLHEDTTQQLHRSQYQNATAIGSDAFFGREEKTTTQESTGGEYNWEDIREEAAQKAKKLKDTANNWFSTLSDKLNR